MSLVDLISVGILFVLGVIFLNQIIFITIITVLTVFLWLPGILLVINYLGEYRLVGNRKNDFIDKKFKKVLFANIIIGITLFITLLFILNTLPQIFIDNSNIISQNFPITLLYGYQFIIPATPTSNLSTANIAFSLTLLIIPTFLLSLRLLANKTKKGLSFSFRNSSLRHEILSDPSPEEINKAKSIKTQIIGLYFSFIGTTIAIFYLAICFTAMKYNVATVLWVIDSLLPTYDYFTIIFLIFIEIVAIVVLTYIIEIILDNLEPIVQE